MEKSIDDHWDFVQIGNQYLFIESGFRYFGTVMNDYSTQTMYVFKIRIEKAQSMPDQPYCNISLRKNLDGWASGLVSIIELDDQLNIKLENFKWPWEFRNYQIDFDYEIFIKMFSYTEEYESGHHEETSSSIFSMLNLLSKIIFPGLKAKKNKSDIPQKESKKRVRLYDKSGSYIVELYKSRRNTIEFEVENYSLNRGSGFSPVHSPKRDFNLIYSDVSEIIKRKIEVLLNKDMK